MSLAAIRTETASVPVVILASSQHGAVGLIRSLGRWGVPVYGVHQSLWEPAARSRYLRGRFVWDSSSTSPADSLHLLQEAAKQLGRSPILIPTSDSTALFVAENAEALAPHYLLASPPLEAVRTFGSKKLAADLCRKIGISTPAIALPASREEARNFGRRAKFPVIVKGECGAFLQRNRRPARVAIVSTNDDLLDLYEVNAAGGAGQLIFQEYIPGGDDAVWMFNGYFNSRSQCLFGATGRKLRQFPAHRGSTSLGICQRNEVIEAQTAELVRAVGYCGPLDLGFRFDARDGQYKLLDANPRIGSTFRLFVSVNGMDVARALYLDKTGQTVPPALVAGGRKWVVETNDLASSWSAFREGQLSPGGWLRSLRDVDESAWFAPDDLAPVATLPFLWFHKLFSGSKHSASKRHLAGALFSRKQG